MFGLTNPLTEPLVRLLAILNDAAAGMPLPAVISSYAVAIVLIAVIVKLLTYPLTATQMRSTRSMQELQPKLKVLQKKHKDDREGLAQAQMDLYKEHGVNPLGGCLPLVVQMVILFGLYSAIRQLSQSGALDGQRFLWIGNLAKCEVSPLCSDVGATGVTLPGTEIGIPILLVILVVSQFAYQKFATPPSTDPQAQAMNQTMKFMPLFFAFIFARLAAGLVLYYAIFNLVTVAQQAFMSRGSGSSGSSGLSLPFGLSGGDTDDEKPAAEDDDASAEDDSSDDEDPKSISEEKKYERAPRRRRRRKKSR